MKQKKLKKLKRAKLLELLIEQSKENEMLREQLEATQKKLEQRNIEIENAGSIAEAALKINEVFDAAQRAADQYLENIRNLSKDCDYEEKEIEVGSTEE